MPEFKDFRDLNDIYEHVNKMPLKGLGPNNVKKLITGLHDNQTNVNKNTATYCNVQNTEIEKKLIELGQTINIADSSIYKSSIKIQTMCIRIIANLWNCPKTKKKEEYAGTNTVGSTEAILLAGITLKFRWRDWYCKKYIINNEQIHKIKPNIVISSKYQAAWEKLFKYFDIEPRIIYPTFKKNKIDPNILKNYIDNKTIGVVAILGDHYTGHYDDVFEINAEIEKINLENNFNVKIHVDAASGGFIAPFQGEIFDKKPWDFRNKNVLSISASGHKFGESTLGSGWLILRNRKLLKYISIDVSYLGGNSSSFSLNFSRPASGIYSQMFRFLTLGLKGYNDLVIKRNNLANIIRKGLCDITYKGNQVFEIIDDTINNIKCLPVVAAKFNLNIGLDSCKLQEILEKYNWYIPGYKLEFTHPITHKKKLIYSDISHFNDKSIFRIVCKSSMKISEANDIIKLIKQIICKKIGLINL